MARPKPALVISFIIFLAIVAAIVYILVVPRDKTAAPRQTDSTTNQTQEESKPNVSQGSYVDYADNIIAATPGEKLLFFHASWCPQCRMIEADIKDGGIPENTTIIKVDYDNSQELKQKYGVLQQTTFVKVDDKGAIVKKFVAYEEPTLAAVIEGTR